MSSKIVALSAATARRSDRYRSRSRAGGAREKGAQTRTFYLTEQHIEFLHPLPPVCPGAGRGAQQMSAAGRYGVDPDGD